MRFFGLTNETAQHTLTVMLFLAVAAQLALCLYQKVCNIRRGRRYADIVLLLALTAVCAGSMAARTGAPEIGPYRLLIAAAVIGLIVRAGFGIRLAYRTSHETLSISSIKETLDNLGSGIMFSDADHRVILINHTMGELVAGLSGSYPQVLEDLYGALEKAGQVSGATGLYRFPDGRIWRIQTLPLQEPELAGFTQATAEDLTELYAANSQLAGENEALRGVIEETKRMIALVAERVREQETLEIKVRVHNDIGKSLISLSELMNSDPGDREEQLRTLHKAVSLFSEASPALPGTLEEARREAEEMRVSLRLEGVVPKDEGVEKLIAAAARECVTNCVRHAKGSRVTVAINEENGVYTVTITNDGEAPGGPIIEGGGLGSLRRRVESAGGGMKISHYPAFALILKLKESRG
jgi:two-component sensor histidine kinase